MTNSAPYQFTIIRAYSVHNRLDAGSALLLEALFQQPKQHFSGRMLDFACGSGVLAAALQHYTQATQMTGIDVNTLALAAAEKTWQQLGCEFELIASDGLSVLMQKVTTATI